MDQEGCYGSSNPLIHISKERRGIFEDEMKRATSSSDDAKFNLIGVLRRALE